ncbi:MAG: SRPBCC family protein [Actinomycetota bacterium]|nr:SRPBCC family protein [Actinomycetota bacterium]
MNASTATASLECDTTPSALLALIGDPRQIPRWAPAFADTVTGGASSGWLVSKNGQTFALRVLARPEAGTVDYLREIAPGDEGGAYLRVVPRIGGGSVVVITVPVPSGGDPAAVAETLGEELIAMARLADSASRRLA